MEKQRAKLYSRIVMNHNLAEDLTAMFVRMHRGIIRTLIKTYLFIYLFVKSAFFCLFDDFNKKKETNIVCISALGLA